MQTTTIVALLALLFTLATFISAALLRWLWNMTMPEALGTKPIRYWVAFRLLLIGLLLSSSGLVRFNITG